MGPEKTLGHFFRQEFDPVTAAKNDDAVGTTLSFFEIVSTVVRRDA